MVLDPPGPLERRAHPDCSLARQSLEMHTKGKSGDEAAQLLMNECGSPRSPRRDAGSWLHQLHARQARILKLRDGLPREDGRLTDFHNRLLAAGLTPIKIIRHGMMGEDGPVIPHVGWPLGFGRALARRARDGVIIKAKRQAPAGSRPPQEWCYPS
jgi:hypothetical protein